MGFQPTRQSLIFRDLTAIFKHMASIKNLLDLLKNQPVKEKREHK